MDYVCLILGILFAAAGIGFASGRLHEHLSAWKQMSAEEKSRIKIEPLCRNIGCMIALNGILFILRGFIPAFSDTIFTCAIIIWMVIAGIDVYYISKSRRYKSQ